MYAWRDSSSVFVLYLCMDLHSCKLYLNINFLRDKQYSSLRYKNQPLNVIYGNNCCLF
jgi:hypothetical protein